ncbi:bifunctional adenosylcobinamide kinase/adenosylcobinamide-phosphate guanylyltransferase [Dehalobacter sp. DCM]|uniref:bifunctional adenosylcobinamide kinase/adenosylcobinamide-phosphate guanylyltransferase n=1 Tax=Dehalobacter sp. DCM TaxID=2907827 RepID=UPI0030820096|nr:bifunctional adenosylcobinamide kinase/adenosylcobinamide-phosphate guanylyltransferase [Dehalobacter sp. DCM]
MILIIGGNSQGKLACALRLLPIQADDISDGEVCRIEEAFQRKVINHFHHLVKRLRESGIDPQPFIMEGIAKNPAIVVISDELSSAVVPIVRESRELQEAVGRILCQLAQQADRVYRVFCGIPSCIKGDANG